MTIETIELLNKNSCAAILESREKCLMFLERRKLL